MSERLPYEIVCIEFGRGVRTDSCDVCSKNFIMIFSPLKLNLMTKERKHSDFFEAAKCLKKGVCDMIRKGYKVVGVPKIIQHGLFQEMCSPEYNFGKKVINYELIHIEFGMGMLTARCMVCEKGHSRTGGAMKCMKRGVSKYILEGWRPLGNINSGFQKMTETGGRNFACQALVLYEYRQKEEVDDVNQEKGSENLKSGSIGYVY